MRFIIVICLGALLVGTAAAQDHPRVETFLGYTYVRAYPQNVSPAVSANGGRGEFVFNFNRWIGGVLDAGAVTNNSVSGFSISNTQAFFMAGPRISFRRSRFKPYGQAVFGGVYYTASPGRGYHVGSAADCSHDGADYGPGSYGRNEVCDGHGPGPGYQAQPLARFSASSA
jgi:hypothetical protein